MKKQLFKYTLLILLFFPVYLIAQPAKPADHNMTGLWKGRLYNDTTQKFLPYEIAISEEKGKLFGYSYTLFEEDGKKEVGIKRIKIKIKDDEVIIEDVEMISNNYSIPPPKKVRVQSILSLYLNDTAMQLSGRWSTNKTWEYRQLTGNLQVNRAVDYKQTALFERLTVLNLAKDLSFVQPERNPAGTDIAVKDKPVKENKLPLETLEKSVAVAQVSTAPELTRKDIEKKEQPVAKTVINTPAKTQNATEEKTLIAANHKAGDQATAKTESPVSKTIVDTSTTPQLSANEKALVAVNNKPVNNATMNPESPVSKTAIDKPAAIVDKKPALPVTTNDALLREKQSTQQSITKTSNIEKPTTNSVAATSKKTAITIKDTAAKKGVPVDIAIIKSSEKPKQVIIPSVEKNRDVVIAVNDNKTITRETIVANKPVAAPPLPKPSAPIVTAKKTVVAEKPVVIPAPKDPVKIEPIIIAAVPIPTEKKKQVPVEITAPVIAAAANVADRKMKNEQAVYFESDSLVLTLYDNGEVDGDTVSVLMNGQIIFAKQGLSAKANSKTIYIDKNMSDSLSMVMYAENLGSIPPNTGLLIIMDGEKRYEVRFSADLQTNAAILLRRKQKEK